MKKIKRDLSFGRIRSMPRWLIKVVLSFIPVCIFYLNSFASPGYAGSRVTGKVLNEKGEAMAGATVTEKGHKNATVTLNDGSFAINTVGNGPVILEVSFVGFEAKEVRVTDAAANLTIQLTARAYAMDAVIVVAYGTQKKISSTAAVSSVGGTELAESPVANISNSMAGKLSGVSIRTANGGQPGADDPDIHIRGIATTGSNGPLVVVDGVIRANIDQIDPNAIDNVTVLKDAAAVAPYGLGGANGVLLITTKRGKAGAPTLSLNSYYGVQNPTYLPKTLSAADYMRLTDEAYLNDNPGMTSTIPYSTSLISNYPSLNKQNPDLYPSSDPTATVLLKNAPITENNLQLSGGSRDVKYFAGLGILDQQGIVSPYGYQRYSYNLNLDVNATATTLVTLSVSGSFEHLNSIDASTSTPGFFRGLLKYLPIDNLTYSNGDYGASAGNSPYGVLNSGGYYHKNITTMLSTIAIEQKLPFIKGLSIKGTFSYDPYNFIEKGWHEPYYYYTQNTSTTPYTYTQAISTSEGAATQTTSLYQNYWANNTFTYQGYLNYHDTFGKSDITGLFVAEAKNNNQLNFGASLNNYQVQVDELNFGSSNANDRGVNGTSSSGSQVGYVYRVNYGYDNKYFLEASGRYDGHYYFAPGHQYAYFPAFSAGWVLSNEKFLSKVHFLDYLKIRGSWGKAGNLAGSAFQYLSGYTLYANSYAFGNGNVVQGSYQPQVANPNITWEISTKQDVGFEATLLRGLIKIDADYFWERRTGMLLAPSITVPVEFGLTLAQQNEGIMDNHGFELTAGTQHKFADGLVLNINGNFSFAKNKLVQIFESPSTFDNPNRKQTGRPLGTVFGYEAQGLFTTANDKNGDGIINTADGYTVTQFGALHPGDIKYVDQNHDGVIDANDNTVIGHPLYPEITYGITPSLSWKGVDLTLFFQGSAIESINVNGLFQVLPFSNNNSNTTYNYFDNRWTPTHQNALYPRITEAPYANNTQTSSYWMVNNGYMRLKTINIGYTFPSSLTKRWKISRLRVYASAQDLFTLSKLKYMDPEVGYNNLETSYPIQKVSTVGLTASF